MKYYYFEIEGDVEEHAENILLTLFAHYKKDTNTTAIKVHADNKHFLETAELIYGQLGTIIKSDYIEL